MFTLKVALLHQEAQLIGGQAAGRIGLQVEPCGMSPNSRSPNICHMSPKRWNGDKLAAGDLTPPGQQLRQRRAPDHYGCPNKETGPHRVTETGSRSKRDPRRDLAPDQCVIRVPDSLLTYSYPPLMNTQVGHNDAYSRTSATQERR